MAAGACPQYAFARRAVQASGPAALSQRKRRHDMSSSDDPKPKTVHNPRTATLRAQREARLAEALRRNLKRRKDQSRGRTSNEAAGETSGDDGDK